ncbi:MAG: hypothetical protein KGN16_19965 [Burkholderiales bacterium]|nr:hypothetical protein [Burkholderiales bacterium]
MQPRDPAPVIPPGTACLVEVIELKWLLAGRGIHIHVERLLDDPEYARQILDRAAAIPESALRETAARLRTGLKLG